ncbi:hypothetical protein Tco_1121165 [Tanacetum coccineum]|uniref:Uncharacterized protein n=1 Tax=Tanacetum coccineum TaxID=301880 RepID=A0ABQ5IYC9_9ASTR
MVPCKLTSSSGIYLFINVDFRFLCTSGYAEPLNPHHCSELRLTGGTGDLQHPEVSRFGPARTLEVGNGRDSAMLVFIRVWSTWPFIPVTGALNPAWPSTRVPGLILPGPSSPCTRRHFFIRDSEHCQKDPSSAIRRGKSLGQLNHVVRGVWLRRIYCLPTLLLGGFGD